MEDIKIAVAGNVDSGKSTLIGVLSNNKLDDGRGSARSLILKNKHEKESGRTSSITFNNIKQENNNVLTLIDLAGHEKYLKTTMYGLNGLFVDYGLIIIGANMGMNKMTKEHISIMLYLKIPFIVVLTKIDICPEHIYERVLRNVKRLLNLPLFNKKVFELKSPETDIDKFLEIGNYDNFIPIISISNKTGKNVEYLKKLLNILQPREKWSIKNIDGSLMYIDSKFYVHGIGLIISGTVKGDTIKLNDNLWVGPIEGKFIPIRIKSIHNNMRESVPKLINEQYGCIAIKFTTKETFNRNQLKKGVIAFSDNKFKNNVVISFIANIKILHHSTTISDNYQAVIHCGQVRQSAKLEILDKLECLRTGDNAKVKFTFIRHAEYIEEGNTIFFRDGNTKGFGKVVEIIYNS